MQNMTPEEIKDFLTRQLHTGKLASVRKDGRPHVAPVWFVLDGDDLLFTTWHTTVKSADLHRDPRVAICVDDEKPPYTYVLIEGTATITEKAPDLLYWATRIAQKYMGEELGQSYGKRNAVDGELLVRVTPTRIIAQKEIAA